MSYGTVSYGEISYGSELASGSGTITGIISETISVGKLLSVNWISNPIVSVSFSIDEELLHTNNSSPLLLDTITGSGNVFEIIVSPIMDGIIGGSTITDRIDANSIILEVVLALDMFGYLQVLVEDIECIDIVVRNLRHLAQFWDRIELDDTQNIFFWETLLDVLTSSDSIDLNILGVILEGLSLSDSLASQADQKVFVIENTLTSDRLYVGIPVSVLENAGLIDLAVVTRSQLVELINNLSVNDLLGSVGVFAVSSDEFVDLSDIVGTGAFETIVSSLAGSDSVAVRLLVSIALNGSMEITASPITYVSRFLEAVEEFLLNDSNSTQTDAVVGVTEEINISHFFDPVNMKAWVINPENYAVYNYTFGFTESCRFGNDYMMADGTGLYVLGGTKDNGEDIVSVITTSAMDFGTDSIKQVPAVLLGTNGTDFILQVSIDGGRTARYQINYLPDKLGTKRIKLGKGLIGKNWQFTLITDNNSGFDLDSFEFYPIVFKRKHNG